MVDKKKNELKTKVNSLPDICGIYIFKDASGDVLYIGKAKSLKKRIQSYFGGNLSSKTQALVSKIEDIEYKIASSEAQAQLLEASLIKERQPQYNVSLKDDKSFPLIRITDEDFPVVSICRKKKLQRQKDKAVYFGPYTNAQLLRQAIKMIRRIFGFRSCKGMPKESCLYYHLKLCPAPCIRKISRQNYQEIIRRIGLFLECRYEELLSNLYDKMKQAAKEKRFEEAAGIRDQISALNTIDRSQTGFGNQFELEDLKKLVNLNKSPQRIEAFDISNISGKQAAGSMVSFFKGLPDKDNYRRFRIKTFIGVDDYKMLREIISRRYSRLSKENRPLPDLVIIDGGKGHLKIAENEINKLNIKIPLISIAKDREHIYTKGRSKPIKLSQDTPALNLIRRVRDEAHRFAQAYHHVLRRKKVLGK